MAHQRVAIVTGASGEIGCGISTRLADDGFRIAAMFRSRPEQAGSLVAGINHRGGEAIAIRGDVTKATDVDGAIELVTAKWGRIDALVNNAGAIRDRPLLSMSEEDWTEVIAVNLNGAFLCSRRALFKMMQQRCGVIVNIASVAGLTGAPYQANYASAKAALGGLTRTIALEYARYGVRCNAVAPGFVETAINAHLTLTQREKIITRIPVQHAGVVDDVAFTVAFLCSERAKYITGQVIAVDGGLSLGDRL